MKFVELTKTEYDKFARKHPYRNFMNSEKAFEVKEKYGFHTCLVGVKENDKIVAAAGLTLTPVMRVYKYAYAQRGFLIDYKDKELLSFFTKELISYLKGKKVLYMRIDPYVLYREHDNEGNIVEGGFHHQYVLDNLAACGFQHAGFKTGFDMVSQARWMVTLNIAGKTEEDLLKSFDQQTRWSINKAAKLGVQVKEEGVEGLPEFEKIINYAAKTRHFLTFPTENYRHQIETYGTDYAKIVTAYIDTKAMKQTLQQDLEHEEKLLQDIEEGLSSTPNSKKLLKKKKVQEEAIQTCHKRRKELEEQEEKYGEQIIIAEAYFILYEDELVYVTSGAYDEFRKYNGPYAIQWYMLRYALKHGITRYNFYGTSGDFSKDAVDHGVFEFKKGFHGVVEELVGDFVIPVYGIRYRLYNCLKALKNKIKPEENPFEQRD